jgi:hypothetical protein
VGTAAVALSAALAGCGDRNPAAKPAPPPERAYVRLDELIRRHPLQADLRRLDEAEAALRRSAAAAGAADGAAARSGGLTLPALSAGGGAADQESLLAQRRGEARVRVRARAERGIEEYTASLEYRRLRRLEQRRSELEAVARGRVAEQERNARADVLEGVRSKVLATADPYLSDAVKEGALVNDLTSPAPLTRPLLAPGPPADVLEQQIRELEAAGPGQKVVVSDRARLTRDLRAVRARMGELLALEERIRAEGDAEIARRLAAIREQSASEIAAQLAALRAESNLDARVGAERSNLDGALTFEARTAQEARALLAGGAGTGTVTLAGVAGPVPVPAAGGPGRLRAALARVAAERAQIAGLLRAEVIDSVRDAAAARNIDVTFGPGGGRTDRTRDFSEWIGLEVGKGVGASARVSLAGGAAGGMRPVGGGGSLQ